MVTLPEPDSSGAFPIGWLTKEVSLTSKFPRQLTTLIRRLHKDMEYVFAIVLLESPDEDVDKLLGIQKDKYKPFRNIAPPREFLKATCGKYRS